MSFGPSLLTRIAELFYTAHLITRNIVGGFLMPKATSPPLPRPLPRLIFAGG
nr:MAG TPA: hypothetical protein [Caudoviricetes sp.]